MYRRYNLLFALAAMLISAPAYSQTESDPSPSEPTATDRAESPDTAAEPATEAPADAPDETPDDTSAPESPTAMAVEVSSAEAPTSLESLLEAENAERARVNRIGMGVLGGWAIGNIAWGTVGLLTTNENPQRAFHMTNAAWNLVNGLIATVGYFSNTGEDAAELNLVETVSASHDVEKVLLFNAGLDAAYIAGGAYLIAKGLDEQKDGLVGTGRSVILQGAFLLVFDATMYAIHMVRRKKFQKSIGAAP